MSEEIKFNPVPVVADDVGIPSSQVEAVVRLLGDGNTVPFIARYRKEITGNLDEIKIRSIEERHAYVSELEKRRQAILSSIEEQGKMTDTLRKRIQGCSEKAALEDLYLPYKPKRRTRGTIAREKGLEPLAGRILQQPEAGDPMAEAAAFVDAEKGVEDAAQALSLARDIVAETVAENADIRAYVREVYAGSGLLVSTGVPEKAEEGAKFKDYFDHNEPVANIPSHRYLAIRRGEREGALKAGVEVDTDGINNKILTMIGYKEASPFSETLTHAAADGFKRLISPSVENDVRVDLKLRSDRSAVQVFADNLKSLLLAAPFGTRSVIGIDPGLRTGCKCAALDATGKFLSNVTFNLVKGDTALEAGKREFLSFVRQHHPEAIAVGNGTGGRETMKFVRDALRDSDIEGITVVQVSESGASVYSASELAGKEFPELDLTIRGAISIARRLQDPLAELVKIEPKSIGVGQYQHDVHQPLLARKLDDVIESCVNHVGVELNTASAPLLSRVAGIGPKLASNIIAYREENGAFNQRRQLLKVSKLGPRAFEQAAGFLRIRSGTHPLDASAVHPERYTLVSRMASDIKVDLEKLVGDPSLVSQIEINHYVSDDVGEPTLRDIIDELKKPGRDPRETFDAPAFRDDVQTMEDLIEGMNLEGVVTNVTAFGAFVDVGVHQDGLVHISQLADRFVKDPNEVVKVGDKIKVRVLSVDIERKRISLTAKSGAVPRNEQKAPASRHDTGRGNDYKQNRNQRPAPRKFTNNPFADLLKK